MTAGSLALAVSLASTPAWSQSISNEEAAALRDEIGALKARLEVLESRLAATPPMTAPATPPQAQVAATTASPATKPEAKGARIAWKGSPQIVEGDHTFKPKGRIQMDANYVSAPDGLNDRGLGFSTEARRIRLGAEGSIGSGIGYKLELELSDNAVDLVDTFITYESGPLLLRLGNQNPLWGLDELTGDTSGSLMERAAFTDAFNFERRLGLSAQYSKGALLLQAGVFSDDVTAVANSSDGGNGGDENNSFSIDGRAVLAPKFGKTQLHFGASAHWRNLKRIGDAGVRYRQRPYIHSSNSRLISTPVMVSDNELGYGGEFAVINGRWHGAAEVFFQRAARREMSNVTFWGGYAEVGYFLTRGDTRSYKEGIFGASKPKKPIDKGGMGSVQVNLRYDYLDLDDRDIVGGTQNAYIVGVVWAPIQGLRFNANYAHILYTDAMPLQSHDRSYDIDVIGTRFEFDF